MLLKRLSELDAQDILSLVGNVPESKFLEFKSALPGGQDVERKEFVADVTAFANATGGHIIFGITEDDDAVAAAIVGIVAESRDAEERRLGEMLRSGTEPRFSDFSFKWIDVDDKTCVLVVHVAQSWQAPHRVTLRAHDRFYLRNERGKHPMNTDELRASFNLAGALSDKIQIFRKERVELVAAGETPVPMGRDAKLVLHIIPMASFVNSPALNFNREEIGLAPLGSRGFSTLQTLEGPISFSGPEFSEDPVRAYTLQFRNGIIEAVDEISRESEDLGKRVFIGQAEQTLVSYLPGYIKYLVRKELPLPYFVFVSMTGIRNGIFVTERDWSARSVKRPLRRDNLLFPEARIADAEIGQPIQVVMRPVFDLMWNSFGYSNSLNFNSKGEFEPWT